MPDASKESTINQVCAIIVFECNISTTSCRLDTYSTTCTFWVNQYISLLLLSLPRVYKACGVKPSQSKINLTLKSIDNYQAYYMLYHSLQVLHLVLLAKGAWLCQQLFLQEKQKSGSQRLLKRQRNCKLMQVISQDIYLSVDIQLIFCGHWFNG